jgi:hypothetical protein
MFLALKSDLAMMVPHPEQPNKTISTKRRVVFMIVTSFQSDYTVGWGNLVN